MNLVRQSAVVVFFFLSIFNQTLFADETNTIKMYLFYGTATAIGFPTDVDVSFVINGQLLVAKNHPAPLNDPFKDRSYVEVPESLNYKEITQAQLTWLIDGKKYLCKADQLPLFVQKGDKYTATQIHFDCK